MDLHLQLDSNFTLSKVESLTVYSFIAFEGFVSVTFSSKNVIKQGKHTIEVTVNNHKTRLLINIGKPNQGNCTIPTAKRI